MKSSKKYFLFIIFFYCGYTYAQPKNDSIFDSSVLSAIKLTDAGKSGTVFLSPEVGDLKPALFIFLSPECPLCQNYSLVLNKIYREYGEKVRFYGIIPGKTYTAETIKGFAKKYKIVFPLFIDRALSLSHYLKATTTPEVILLNNNNELLYKGAIDDWFLDIGKQRTRTTKDFLRDALDQQLGGKTVALKRTKAIGCYINDY